MAYLNPLHFQIAPSISADAQFIKSSKQGLSIGFDLAQFWSISKDTITELSTGGDYFYKTFDFDGKIQVGSIRASWVRFFGQNERCVPYIKTGGEFMYKRRTFLMGSVISNEFEGVRSYSYGVAGEFSFNARVGFGLKHQLSKRVKIFEEVSGSYMLFNKQSTDIYGWTFYPTKDNQYFLLNMSVGITFSLDQE